MAGSVNKVLLLGYVGADPDVRQMTSGGSVATLSLATTEKWKDKKTSEQREKTEWNRVVFFDPLASIVEKYVKKGSQLFVEGKLQTRKWQDANGVDKYTTEVVVSVGGNMVLLGGSPGSIASGTRSSIQDTSSSAQKSVDDQSLSDVLDDDIPF